MAGALLDTNAILASLPHEPVTELIAEEYGRLKALLEAGGTIIGDNDSWSLRQRRSWDSFL